MPVLHKQIALDQAAAGMVLSDNVLDNQGNILLAKDVTLSEATIAGLRRHRIEAVSIVAGTLSDDELAEQRRRHRLRLAHLFRGPANDLDDATGILMQYVRYYRLGEEEE